MRSCVSPARDKHLAEIVVDRLGRIEDRQPELLVIAVHGDQLRVRTDRAREAVELRVLQRGHDLAHAVGAEVGEEQRVAVFHAAEVRALAGQHRDRLHELVGDVLIVEPPHRLQRILRLRPDAEREQVVARCTRSQRRSRSIM